MPTSKFRKQLSQGQAYEQKAKNFFEYDTIEYKRGYFKEYDFSFTKDEKKTKVEVLMHRTQIQ
jgi:hypothetical protein